MKRAIIALLACAVLIGLVFLVMRTTNTGPVTPEYEIVPDSEIPPEVVSFYGASDIEVQATFLPDSVTIVHPELGTVTLEQLDSSEGSVYASEDGSITLWDRGDKITIWQNEEVFFEGFGEVSEGDIVQEPSLTYRTWVWESMQTSDGVTMTPKRVGAFTLTFDGDRVSGETDCNSFSGSYAAAEGVLTIGALASTKMYCEGSEEATFTSVLPDIDRYAFDGDGKLVLFLTNERGSMTFSAR
jgi:heat shock protein HslJ